MQKSLRIIGGFSIFNYILASPPANALSQRIDCAQKKFIKEILGHFNIKTTERYLHVGRETFINIESLLDDLIKKEAIEW